MRRCNLRHCVRSTAGVAAACWGLAAASAPWGNKGAAKLSRNAANSALRKWLVMMWLPPAATGVRAPLTVVIAHLDYGQQRKRSDGRRGRAFAADSGRGRPLFPLQGSLDASHGITGSGG